MIIVIMMGIKIERIVVHLVLVHVVTRIELTGMVVNFIIIIEIEVVLVIIIIIVKVEMKNDIIERDIVTIKVMMIIRRLCYIRNMEQTNKKQGESKHVPLKVNPMHYTCNK